MRSLLVLALLVPHAAADVGNEPAIHGSIGGGGALVLLGEDGDHYRNDISLTLKRGRYGGIIAWRAFDYASLDDGEHAGLVTGGFVYEGGAARPRLVLDLVVEAGADLDQKAPLFGGGIHTTLGIIGPLGVVLHTAAYLVIDGVDDSRLHIQANALVVMRW